LVDVVCSIAQTLALVFLGRVPHGFRQDGHSLVFHMGGDPTWTYLVAKRLGQPCFAYGENPFPLQSFFQHVFFSGLKPISATKRTANSSSVGDLVVDAAWLNFAGRSSPKSDRQVVSLYPGSRDYLVMYTLPFLGEVIDLVTAQLPDVHWQLAKADFLDSDFLREIPDVNDGRQLAGQNLKWCPAEAGGCESLMTRQGNRIAIVAHSEATTTATIAVTIPGTTTAELAALGIPMVVFLPLVHSDKVPIPGPLNYVNKIPLIGRYIKRVLAHQLVKSLKFVAIPNRRAKRLIVPEVVGYITPPEVAGQIVMVLRSDRRKIISDLQAVMGMPGAAEALVGELRAHLEY
jgi:hypothetical protein